MNDEALILYYYGDGLSDDERSVLEAALRKDHSLRERYRALRQTLDGLNEVPTERAPAHMAARWHRSIERAAAGERAEHRSSGKARHFPSFAWGALAAALVAGIVIGLYFGDNPAPVPSIAEKRNGLEIGGRSRMQAAVPVSFSRGLQFHLRESREDIMHLAASGNGDRAMLIMDIMRQNRLFEQAARQHDAEDIARVLRAFEPVLLRLANEDINAEDAAALRAKLAFELNVVLTKMEQRESDEATSI